MEILDRQSWIEVRSAAAEALIRAHHNRPSASAEELRPEIEYTDHVFNAALSHLIAKRRLPRNIYQRVKDAELREHIVSTLSQYGGCATDDFSVREMFQIDNLPSFWRIVEDEIARSSESLERLSGAGSIGRVDGRMFLTPDKKCIAAVNKELPASLVTVNGISKIADVMQYARFTGLELQYAAEVIANALEKCGYIVRVGKGRYRTRTTIHKAKRQIRAVFQEYRPYSLEDVSGKAGTDKCTLRHAVASLKRDGEVSSVDGDKLQPTDSLVGPGWPCSECGIHTHEIEFFYDIPLCLSCRLRVPDKYGCISKTRALREFRLREHELDRLDYLERPNPYSQRAAPMRLFLLTQVQELARSKWGSDEPY
jgi:hypothetical protein